MRDERSRLPGGETTNTLLSGVNAFNQPVENLLDEHRAAFFSGNSLFNSAWVQAPSSTSARDGLGPLFNARNCSACHFEDGRGTPPLEGEENSPGVLLRLRTGFDEETEVAEPDPNYGGQLQPLALPDLVGEAKVIAHWEKSRFEYTDGTEIELERPRFELTELAFGPLDENTVVSPRIAPAMIGMGLLELIPDERLLELAERTDLVSDEVSGRVRYVPDPVSGELVIGRFGWKAEEPTVRGQTAAALLGDLGITSSIFPTQNCTEVEVDCQEARSGGEPEIEDNLLDNLELYSQMLAVPERRKWNDERVIGGERVFGEVGCSDCHVPSHRTGVREERPELSDQLIWPYTDLLLHDLGKDLADAGSAGAGSRDIDAEWRTPPLWGLGLVPGVNGHQRLLHDGRADGVEEAILWHGGEASASRTAFAERTARDREALIAFVNSL